VYDTLLCAYDTVGNSFSFKYDPFGRRIYKSSSSGTSVFAYDGDNLVEETNSSGTAVARYSQGLNIDEPLAMLRSSATSYYHADGLGAVTSLSSAAGSIANTYTYDSFGKPTASTGSLVNPFQYTARESEAETNLYFYRARYYDQTSGRFLSEDPLGFKANTVNFYGYVRDNPVNSTDPMGLQPKSSGGVWGNTVGLVQTTTSFWWQFYRGSMDMWMNYEDMKKANTIGADKYFHCMANCEAARRGPGGVLAAQVISNLREDYGYWKGDPMGDSMDDMT